jgi:hypothetical protein
MMRFDQACALRFMNVSFMNMKEIRQAHRHINVCNQPCMAHFQGVQFCRGTLNIVYKVWRKQEWHG